MPQSILIKNAQVHTGTKAYSKLSVFIDNGKIIELEEQVDILIKRYSPKIILDAENHGWVLPGMIDLHIHGVQGADVMDGKREALERIAAALPSEGTTAFLATTMTMDQASIERALINAAAYSKSQSLGAEMIGVHLEGPFINREKRGAQEEQYIVPPDATLLRKFLQISDYTIRYITMAPECDANGDVQAACLNIPIRSLGHTACTVKEAEIAILNGMNHATHLFNGMSGIHHRDVGAAGSVLLSDQTSVEVIADGEHVSKEAIRLAYRLKGPDKFILVTDSIRAKGLPDGEYKLGGQSISVTKGIARTKDGSLAGSVLKMNKARKNFSEWVSNNLEDLVKICSITPAKLSGVFDRKGSLEKGKDADLILVADTGEVVWTIANGLVVYERKPLLGKVVIR